MRVRLPSRIDQLVAVATRQPLARFLVGQGLDQVGNWINRTAVGWYIWEMTQSPAWLGVVAFLWLAPTFLLGPVGGVLADRVRKRLLLGGAKTVSAAASLLIAALVFLDLASALAVAAVVSVVGCAFSLSQASGKTIISELVDRSDLSTAVALNSVAINLATFVGPALAGILILQLGIAASLFFSAMLIAIHSAIVFSLPAGSVRARGAKTGLIRDLVEGIAYVRMHAGMASLLILHAGFSFMARPFMDMAPGIASTFFGRGAEGLAAITSAVGAGAIVGGAWLAQRGGEGLGKIVIVASLALVAALGAFLLVSDFVFALPFAALFGTAMVIRQAGIQTMLQLGAQERFRGRVLGLYLLILHGGGALGGLVVGMVAQMIGIRGALAGAATMAVAVWIWLVLTRYRSIIDADRRPD